MKISKKIIFLLLCFLPLFITVNAQGNAKKRAKQVEKAKLKKDEESLKNYQKAIKRHHKIQTKDTRKKMKETRRKSKKFSDTGKVFFIKRWFNK